jgi:hypothetical protein
MFPSPFRVVEVQSTSISLEAEPPSPQAWCFALTGLVAKRLPSKTVRNGFFAKKRVTDR